MKKAPSYRSHIIHFIVWLAVVVQILFVVCCITQHCLVTNKIYDNVFATQTRLCRDNFDYIEEAIADHQKLLADNGIAMYASRFVPLRNQEEQQRFFLPNREMVYRDAYGEIFEGFYILGQDKNQYTYKFTYPEGAVFQARYVTSDILNKAGIIDYLTKNFMSIFVYSREAYGADLQDLTPEERELLADFEEDLDGKLVQLNMLGGGFVVRILRWEFMDSLFGSADRAPQGIVIRDKMGRVLYEKELQGHKFALLRRGQTTSSSGDYTIEFTSPNYKYSLETLGLTLLILLVALGFIFLARRWARLYADTLLRPYRSLGNIMRMQAGEDVIEPIDLEEVQEGQRFSKYMIGRKIFAATVSVAVIPALLSACVYMAVSGIDGGGAARVRESFCVEESAKGVIKRVNILLRNVSYVSARDYSRILSYGYEGAGSMKSVILTDKDFNIKYINLTDTLDSPYISQDLREKLGRYPDRNLAVIPGDAKIYGSGRAIAVSVLRDDSGAVAGYLCMPGQELGFSDLKALLKTDFVLTDAGGNVFSEESSMPDQADSGSARKDTVYKQDIGSMKLMLRNLTLTDELTGGQWDLMRQNIIWVLLILLGVLLFAWSYSFRIIAPFEKMVSDLQAGGNGIAAELLQLDNVDEVRQVIWSYNRLVRKVNGLMEEQVRMKTREQELSALKAQAELNALQHQINPHFLYNTLEQINIQALSMGNIKVNEMVAALTDLFKYSTRSPNSTVTVAAEMQHTENYLKIQKYRYEEKFSYEIRMSPEAARAEVFKLAVQPLAENAFTHGFCNMLYRSKILCEAYIEEGSLYIRVSDNGKGMSDEELEALRARVRSEDETQNVGLRNVYRRVLLFTRQRGDMLIESKLTQGTRITLVIPLER